MTINLSRRSFLSAAAVTTGAGLLGAHPTFAAADPLTHGMTNLNTQTVTASHSSLPLLGSFRTLNVGWSTTVVDDCTIRRPATFAPRVETVHADAFAHSDDGVPMWFNGTRWVVLVVYACAIANDWIANYRDSGQAVWLRQTEVIVDGLCRRATLVTAPNGRPALFSGTEWSKTLTHNGTTYQLPDPWYSAFNNSTLLALTVRLHQITGDAKYKTWADQLANAYTVPCNRNNLRAPWFMGVDSLGYLWPDMAPMPDGNMERCINGLHSGVRGLGDYADIYGLPWAKDVLRGVAATAAYCATIVRQPGKLSRYYADSTYGIRDYHRVNINTMGSFYAATGYLPFLHASIRMCDDMIVNNGSTFNMASQNQHHMLKIRAGKHRIRTLSGDKGRVVSTLWVNFPKDTIVRTSSRWRISPAWLPMSLMVDGPYAGWWIDEVVDQVFQIASERGRTATGHALDVERPDYLLHDKRNFTVTIMAGTTVTGYDFAWDNMIRASKTRRWGRFASAHADGVANINGRRWYHMCDGFYAGMWIGERGRQVCVEGLY